jgi:hypothetical protein
MRLFTSGSVVMAVRFDEGKKQGSEHHIGAECKHELIQKLIRGWQIQLSGSFLPT